MHRIYVKNEQDKEAYTPAMRSFIQAAIKETLKYEEFEDQCEVSVTLTDNDGIRKLNAEEQVSVIMISHDIAAAVRYATHILHIGRDVFFGPTEDYLQTPMAQRFLMAEGGEK